MTAHEILTKVATDPEYKRVVKNITKGNQLSEDLFQELMLILCQYDKAKLEQVYNSGGLKFFIIRILQNQYKSDSSDFHIKHRRFKSVTFNIDDVVFRKDFIDEEDGYDYNLDKILSIVEAEVNRETWVNKNDWYENNLFKAFLKEGGYRKLEKKTGISRTAITSTVNEYRRKVIKKVECELNIAC